MATYPQIQKPVRVGQANGNGNGSRRSLATVVERLIAISDPLPPRQSARCLRFVAEHPGASNTEIQDGLGIRHPSQVSEVLLRLERDGLAQTERGQRSLNHWELTEHGAELLAALPEGIYDHGAEL
jgi:DNA-binding MarR family transcriptional regulator